MCDAEADLPEVYEPSREDKQRYTKGEIANRVHQSERAIEFAKLAREVGTPHPSQILDLKICDPAMGSGAFLVETCRQLGDYLIDAWAAHNLIPTDIPPDEDEVLYARRQVAQRCLYGVDKNIMAVDLAKLSLWLVTLAKDHPFTFLDHSLRHGDSLVGLTRRQIIGFHWEPKKQKQFGEDLIQKRLDRATEARAKILNAREDVPYRDQEQRLAVADEALNVVRMTGDACVCAFFDGSKKKEREARCDEIRGHVEEWYASGHDINKRTPIAAAAASLRSGEHVHPPFHWEIEFPEVFSRENGGFDGFVGNPPFLRGKSISSVNGDAYKDWLAEIMPQSNSSADLCTKFLLRAYGFNRNQGTLGFVTTNTIRQGDTRSGGLRVIRANGGTIYHAVRRMRWPGEAAVIVSRINVARAMDVAPCFLDGREVGKITAFLFDQGPDEDPTRLKAQDAQSYQGSVMLGPGFTFDADGGDTTSSITEMNDIISRNPRANDVIYPLIGGQELLNSPTLTPSRYAIDFFDRTLEEASKWPELIAIVQAKVKPQRDGQKRQAYRERWWQYAERQPRLYAGLACLKRCIVAPQTCSHLVMAFLPANIRFSQSLNVLLLESTAAFTLLQSRIHEAWARFLASTLKDDLRYTPTDCFETFPFPCDWGKNHDLLDAGQVYYDRRAEIMIENSEGLTPTYNRFHDPHEKSADIENLRELHAAMDRAVLEAYGWDDLAKTATCEFLLDYEEEDDDEPGAKKSKKKKPWRLRWPDDFRDEVLARLLELNEQRHKEELLAGKSSEKPKKEGKQRKQRMAETEGGNESANDQSPQKELF